MTRVSAGALARICALTSCSISQQLLRRHRLEVREVEAQPVGRDQRALLLYVRAEHLAQRRVQQVRRAVIERGRLASLPVHLGLERVAEADRSLHQLADMRVRRAALLRVAHDEAHVTAAQLARIAHLAAGLGVERGAIEHHLALVAGLQCFDLPALLQQREHAPARRRAPRNRETACVGRTSPRRSGRRRTGSPPASGGAAPPWPPRSAPGRSPGPARAPRPR